MIRILKNVKFGNKYYREFEITDENDINLLSTRNLITSSIARWFDINENKLKIFYFSEADNAFHLMK